MEDFETPNRFNADTLGSRVKALESAGDLVLPNGEPICIRLDGRSFHTFTRGCERPFDSALRSLMTETTRLCAAETNACLAYTQSDEISLVLRGNGDPEGSQAYFGGRVRKITSCLASRATIVFNSLLPKYLPGKADLSPDKKPVFDCRVWSVPTRSDACDVIQWREIDARVNAVEMAAQANFSHGTLQGKSNKEMKAMLLDKGIDFNSYPAVFRRGTYIQRRATTGRFTVDELEMLPPKHAARTNPDLMVTRHSYVELDLPPFTTLSNRESVVFDGTDPLT